MATPIDDDELPGPGEIAEDALPQDDGGAIEPHLGSPTIQAPPPPAIPDWAKQDPDLKAFSDAAPLVNTLLDTQNKISDVTGVLSNPQNQVVPDWAQAKPKDLSMGGKSLGKEAPNPDLTPPKNVTDKTGQATPVAKQSVPGWAGGPENFLNAEGRGITGSLAGLEQFEGENLKGAANFANDILSSFDKNIDPFDPSTNYYKPYTDPLANLGQRIAERGVQQRSDINQIYPEDPNRPISSTAGNIAGFALPVAVTGGGAGVAIGSGEFGSQLYTGARDQGVPVSEADAPAALGFALGGYVPKFNIFHAAPATASATWGQLAKNVGYGGLLNASKAYWEMAGVNQVSGEASNAVLPPDQQQSQAQLAYSSLEQALPMALLGAGAHVVGQAGAEAAVSAVAQDRDAGVYGPHRETDAQDKSSFIVNTTKSINDLANDTTKTPQEKMAAVTGFLQNFSPQAQQVIMAHVQNVGKAVADISKAADAAKQIEPTNPLTSQALLKTQTDTIVSKAADGAKDIENQADQAEKEAQAALAAEEKPEEAQPEPEPTPEEPKEEPLPENASATQEKLAASLDPDIAARGKQLAEEREALITEIANSPESIEKERAKEELDANTKSTQALAEEPEEIPEKPEPKPEPTVPAPKGTLHYDEDGKPYYVPDVAVPDIKPNAETPQEPTAEKPGTETTQAPESVGQEPPAEQESVPQGGEAPVEPASKPAVGIDGKPIERITRAAAQAKLDGLAPGKYTLDQVGNGDKITVTLKRSKDGRRAWLEDDKGNRFDAGDLTTGEATDSSGKSFQYNPDLQPLGESPVRLDGMTREGLEQVARNEGHSDQDINEAKGDDDLRDLINAKRVMSEPESDRTTGLARDGKAMVDTKANRLTGKYKTAFDSLVKAAKQGGLKLTNKFILAGGRSAAGMPFSVASHVRAGNFDSVLVNPIQLSKDIDWINGNVKPSLRKDAVSDYLRTIFSEEFVHNQGGLILHKEWQALGSPGKFSDYYDAKFAQIYDRMTQKARREVADKYGGNTADVDLSKSSKEIGNQAASTIAEEYARMLAQRNILKRYTTEEAISRLKANKPLRTYFQKIADRFSGILDKMRADGKSDSEVQQIQRHFETLLAGKSRQKAESTYDNTDEKAVATAASPIDRGLPKGNGPGGSGRAGTPQENERGGDRRPDSPESFRNSYLADYANQIRNGSRKEGADALMDFARRNDLVLRPDQVEKIAAGRNNGQTEHDVYRPDAGNPDNRIYKITKGRQRFGQSGPDELDYLNQFEKLNALVPGLDTKIHGVIDRKGWPAIVSSQNYMPGKEANRPKLDAYMAEHGFERGHGDGRFTFTHPSGVEITDAHTKNVVEDADGRMIPIDVKVFGDVKKPLDQMRPEPRLNPDFTGAKTLGAPEWARPEDQDLDDYFGGDEGVGKPQLSDEEASILKPFDENGGELKATGQEKIEPERAVPGIGERKEQSIADRIQSLSHVDLPQDTFAALKNQSREQAQRRIFNAADRDVAEGNAYVKAVLAAKEWLQKKGTMEGFGGGTIIKHSLIDDSKRLSRGERLVSAEEEPESVPAETEDGEEAPVKTKGVDLSNDEVDANQSAFEPTGQSGVEGSHLQTPAKLAQDAQVNHNIQSVLSKITPYGRRLMELEADTPEDRVAAYPPWVSKAAKEFGVTKAKVIQDWRALHDNVRQAINDRGLQAEDFQRISAARPLREQAFSERVQNDERLPDDMKRMVGTRLYEQLSNKESSDQADAYLKANDPDVAYDQLMKNITIGNPTAVDAMAAQKLGMKLKASPNGEDRAQGANLLTALASKAKGAGQFNQALRAWSSLGPYGVLAEYSNIVDPVVQGAKEPFKGILGQINGAIAGGKRQAAGQTIDHFGKTGLVDAAQEKSDKAFEKETKEADQPIWQSYMDQTAKILSRLGGAPKTADAKGPLEDFSNRLTQNMKSLISESLPENPKSKRTKPLSAEETIREIYNNEPEYKQAWDNARQYIVDKYADDPERLKAFQGALDQGFQVPVKLYDPAVRDEVNNRGLSLRQIAKSYPDPSSIRDSVVNDIISRSTKNEAQANEIRPQLEEAFNKQYQLGKKQNEAAQVRAQAVKTAKESSLKQGVPLWKRYVQSIGDSVARTVDAASAQAKPFMQQFAAQVASNLKALVNETKADAAISNPKLTSEQKLRDIYRHFPEYQQAWDQAKIAMREKIGNDPEKLKAFDAALNKALDAPVALKDKVLTDALKTQGVKLSDLVKEWSGTQNATRDKLVQSIKDRMNLSPDLAQKLGDAISLRFNDRLQKAKQAEITKLLQKQPNNRIKNAAPDLASKIFKAVNLGVPESEAAWNALADKLRLPKYDPAVAAKLKSQAEEIQQMKADGKEGFLTDNKTQEMMDTLANESQKHMSALRQIGQGEMAVFYGNIFGLKTFGRKTLSEMMNLVAETGTMAAVEMRRGNLFAIPQSIGNVISGMYGRGGVDFRSIMMTGRGMRQGSEPGYNSGYSLTERGKIFGNVPVLSKFNTPLSAIYKPIGRFLNAAQAFFYSGSYEARRGMLAYRQALEEKKTGTLPSEISLGKRVDEIMGNSPSQYDAAMKKADSEGLSGRELTMRARELQEAATPDPIREAADDFATRATFMQEPEGFLGSVYKRISSITNEHPWVKLVIPVARVTSNVFNNLLSYVPGAGIHTAINLAKSGEGDRAAQQAAKQTLGALMTVGLVSALGPNIQGAGPKSPDKRKQLMDEGWIPYSVKIGDTYYSYKEAPIALMMAGIGNYYDTTKYDKEDQGTINRLGASLTGTIQFATNSSFLSEINSIMGLLNARTAQELGEKFANFTSNTAGALLPFNQSNLKIIDQLFDPNIYKSSDIDGYTMSQVAFLRRDVNGGLPALNALGDPIQVDPITTFLSSKTKDPIWSALGEKGVFIPVPKMDEQINGRGITTDEYRELITQAGQTTKEALLSGGLDAMQGMTKDQAQEYISALYRHNLAPVKAQIMHEAPDFGQAPPRRRR